MTDSNNFHLKKAVEIAKQNVLSGKGGPFGAIVVKDGVILSATGNSVTTSNDPTAHAEVNAIREACRKLNTFDLSGCEIYSSCQPCPMCMSAIYWSRIDKLYYAADKHDAADAGFDDSFIYDELNKPESERSISIAKVDLDCACEPFNTWKAYDGKTKY